MGLTMAYHITPLSVASIAGGQEAVNTYHQALKLFPLWIRGTSRLASILGSH